MGTGSSGATGSPEPHSGRGHSAASTKPLHRTLLSTLPSLVREWPLGQPPAPRSGTMASRPEPVSWGHTGCGAAQGPKAPAPFGPPGPLRLHPAQLQPRRREVSEPPHPSPQPAPLLEGGQSRTPPFLPGQDCVASGTTRPPALFRSCPHRQVALSKSHLLSLLICKMGEHCHPGGRVHICCVISCWTAGL